MVDDEGGDLVSRVQHSPIATCLAGHTNASLGRLNVLQNQQEKSSNIYIHAPGQLLAQFLCQ